MARRYDPDAIPTVYSRDEVPTRDRPGAEQVVFRGVDTMIGFTTVEPGRETDPHSHPWEQVNYIQEGSCTFHIGDETVEVSAGDMFFVPPGVPHTAEPGDEPCTIMFAGSIRESLLPYTAYQSEFPEGN